LRSVCTILYIKSSHRFNCFRGRLLFLIFSRSRRNACTFRSPAESLGGTGLGAFKPARSILRKVPSTELNFMRQYSSEKAKPQYRYNLRGMGINTTTQQHRRRTVILRSLLAYDRYAASLENPEECFLREPFLPLPSFLPSGFQRPGLWSSLRSAFCIEITSTERKWLEYLNIK
jgi:hypothetical protein